MNNIAKEKNSRMIIKLAKNLNYAQNLHSQNIVKKVINQMKTRIKTKNHNRIST